ncbi:formylglycine-generating enzyme family protein [Pseudomonas luteola]|uniref:formylglycine-generating enzyme family protein n=1 Tax=Pseudomonas luteola TaxID=47886 RepID=UPI003890DC4D
MYFSKTNFLFFTALSILGCRADLPPSKILHKEKVAEIAANIEQKYPEATNPEKKELLDTVLRSLDSMVYVQGGEFDMGDFGWKCDDDPTKLCTDWPCGIPKEQLCRLTGDSDNPLHRVRLSSYLISSKKTIVRDFDLFRKVHGQPVVDQDLRNRDDLQKLYQSNKPVPVKGWQEAKDYCNWLGELSGYPVDLPTEAQWEYAARSRGEYVVFPTDNGSLNFGRNFPQERPKGQVVPRTFDAGSFPPNKLGLYEMGIGNAELLNDWYSPTFYHESPLVDPQGPEHGEQKVERGASELEDPVSTANTVMRRQTDFLKRYRSYYSSFRCAIQQAKPL